MAKRSGTSGDESQAGTSQTAGLLEDLKMHQAELQAQNKELRDAQEQLDRSRREYEALFRYAPVAYFVVTPNGFVVDSNEAATDILGKRRDQTIGMVFSLFVAPNSKKTFLSLLKQATDSGSRKSSELQLKGPNDVSVDAQMDIWCSMEEPRPTCRIAVTNISELKEAERELLESEGRLRESEERFRAILGQSPVAIALTEKRRFVHVNDAFQKLVGYSADELFRMTILDIVVNSRTEIETNERKVMVNGARVFANRTYRRKDGTLVPVEASMGAIRLPGRSLMSIFARDITGKKEGEKEMMLLRTAFQQSGEGVVIADPEGRIQYANRAFAEMTGYDPAELKGSLWTGLKSIDGQEAYKEVAAQLLSKGMWSGRLRGDRRDGSSVDADINITTIKDDSGKTIGVVAIARDVTEELQLERQMVQLQKMEAIGKSTGGIAHDFNNMLAAIIGNIELALDDTPEASPSHRRLEQSLSAAMRGRDLVKKLLTFSRRTERKVAPTHLRQVIDDVYRLLRVTVPKTVQMRITYKAHDDQVLVDPVEMEQLLMNLAVNAADAMAGDPGLLEMTLENAEIKKNDRLIALGLAPGRYVLLSVRDTGTGMTDEVKQHIFEPFFTTKPEGKGTGMGLAVVYGIVKSYNGGIQVHSQLGEGTTFVIYLPAHDA